jgi:hypothetical protein
MASQVVLQTIAVPMCSCGAKRYESETSTLYPIKWVLKTN